jgi:hypothetical protein
MGPTKVLAIAHAAFNEVVLQKAVAQLQIKRWLMQLEVYQESLARVTGAQQKVFVVSAAFIVSAAFVDFVVSIALQLEPNGCADVTRGTKQRVQKIDNLVALSRQHQVDMISIAET